MEGDLFLVMVVSLGAYENWTIDGWVASLKHVVAGQ